MKSKSHRQRTGKFILFFVSFLLCLALAEVALRVLADKAYYIWPPNLERLHRPSPGVMPGISGESRFSVNALGMRADPFTNRSEYHVLAIGGSSTECLYLDDAEAWPFLLQQTLNQKLGRSRVWVGNVGVSGHNTRHHLNQVDRLLTQHPQIDAILLLVGINDLQLRLLQDTNYHPYSLAPSDYKKSVFSRSFSVKPRRRANDSFFRLELSELLEQVAKRLFESSDLKKYVEDEAGQAYVDWRWRRQQASVLRDALPDLTSALSEYTDNLNTIIDLAQSRGVRVIFVTQPVLWSPGLSRKLRDLLWMGGIGDFRAKIGAEYYTAAALAQGMDLYNRRLLAVCQDRKVEGVDLAPMLPHDTTVFYDDAHFNESGARQVARILAQHFLEHEPIKGWVAR